MLPLRNPPFNKISCPNSTVVYLGPQFCVQRISCHVGRISLMEKWSLLPAQLQLIRVEEVRLSSACALMVGPYANSSELSHTTTTTLSQYFYTLKHPIQPSMHGHVKQFHTLFKLCDSAGCSRTDFCPLLRGMGQWIHYQGRPKPPSLSKVTTFQKLFFKKNMILPKQKAQTWCLIWTNIYLLIKFVFMCGCELQLQLHHVS